MNTNILLPTSIAYKQGNMAVPNKVFERGPQRRKELTHSEKRKSLGITSKEKRQTTLLV